MKVKYCNYKNVFLYVLFVFLLGGCATFKPMALNQKVQSIDISQESIAILSVKVSNKYKPRYQPKIKHVSVWTNYKNNNEKYLFRVDRSCNKVDGEYLISFQLPPGKYKLRELRATCKRFPVMSTFIIPIYSFFEIESGEIIYLGHIEAHIKERTNDNELLAGPGIPLIDQAISGASGGTFVVEISDLFENDIEMFKKQYPHLSKHNIGNRTLSEWRSPSKEEMFD